MKKNILILVGVLILTMVNNSLAKGEANADVETEAVDLGSIIVTASRVERELSEVPSSVSIIGKSEIKDSNAKDVPDLLEDLEGIYVYDASGVGTSGRVNMRGFWGGMSTHQLILIDGIPQNKGKDKLVDWNLIPLDNIERIEVVRGPASCLYGDNAMSGVINIITKKPSATPETKISGSSGNFNTQNYKISSSGTFGKTGYYFDVSRKSTDGFRRHCDYEDIHLNGKLNFLIDERQDLKLSLDCHQEERGAHPWALTEAQIEEDRRQARPGSENDKSEVKKNNLSIIYDKDIGNISNAQGTFYYRYEDSESFYTSGSTGSSTQEQLEEENTYGLLARLNINPEIFAIEHSITCGFDLEKNDVDYQEYTAPYQVRGNIRKNYRVERDKIGPYIQDEIRLLEPLKFILGVRYDLVEFDFIDHDDNANSKEREMSSASPKCAIVYTYQENSNLYANYAQAFRTPTIGQMFTYGSYSNPDLNPEEAINYETGINHQFNDYLKAKAIFYWMELDDEIWYDSADNRYKNYGQTSHKGTEASLNFKVIERLTGFVNYAYTRAKYESGDCKSKYLTNIPMHKGSFGVKFETNFGLKTSLIINRIGSSYLNSTNDDKLSGYTTADARVSYEHKWWSVFLAVDNLLDKKYNSYGFKSGRLKYLNPAPERTFTLGMEVNF